MIKNYDKVLKFWLGPQLIVVFKEPHHIEKILCSSKFSQKHDIYDLLKDVLGEGLITASEPQHRRHKKVIQPFFNLQFSGDCIAVFEKYIQICIQKLEDFVDEDYFDIGHIIHLCTSDIIGDAMLGYELKSLEGQNLQYIEAFIGVYKIGFTRLCKPWLHPNFIFNRCELGRKYKKLYTRIKELMIKVTKKSYESKNVIMTPVIDKIIHHLEQNPDFMEREVYYSQLVTLYMASEDTIALTVSAACLCFGMYPEYQKKIVEEIHDVLGKNPQHLFVEGITKLSYLEMCVKDIFRLFPIAPYILRKTLEDLEIDKWFLPKNCGIAIPIYNLHKDPKYWEYPDHFHPDHFLPEVEKNRPSFAYMPFSAGPRGCIGKVFANISVKVMIIKLLQHFEIEAQGKLPDVKFTMDISLRSLNGYTVKIKRRNI